MSGTTIVLINTLPVAPTVGPAALFFVAPTPGSNAIDSCTGSELITGLLPTSASLTLSTGSTPTLALTGIASHSLLANPSGATAEPTGTTPSAFLDAAFGTTPGFVISRGASVWAGGSPPVILHGYSGDGTLSAGATCLIARVPAGYNYLFPAGMTGSSVTSVRGTATAAVTLSILNAGAPVGTVLFPAGSSTGTISASTSFTVAGGSLLFLMGGPDATLAGIVSTFLGSR